MKQWMSLLLAMVMLFFCLPVGAMAAEQKTTSGLQSIQLEQPEATASNQSDGIRITWNEVKDAQSYCIYRRTPDESWALLCTQTDTVYEDSDVRSGVTYSYMVKAKNGQIVSADEHTVSIPRLEQPTIKLANKANGVNITWDAVKTAQSYNVYRKASGGSWKKLENVTATSYRDKTAEDAVVYSYRVRAKHGDVLSSSKQSAQILRLAKPDVTLSNVQTGVSVRWNAVKGAESYRVYRKVPGGSFQVLTTGLKALSFTDTTAKSGTTYQYTVRAFGGGVLSGYIETGAFQHLSRPTVTAQQLSATGIKLRWKAVTGAQKYIVYVKTADMDWETLYTGTDTDYTAKKLTPGQTYSFRVRAVSDTARSARSYEVSKKATYPAPDYKVKLKAGKGIQISWTAVDGAGSYRVYRREIGGSWKTLKTTTATSYVDTSGRAGVTYEYAVRAFELANAGGVYGVRATGKKIVYSKVDPNKKMVALTFDDGPSIYTKDILDQLEKYNAHATFFVVGNRVSGYASTVRRAYQLGCEIGNHSWSHPNLASVSVKTMKNEIDKTDAAIKKVIGKKSALLRPPYGAVDSDVKQYAGKPLIHWSIDTLDWSTRNSSKTISAVLNNVRDGSIVLMHDLYAATRTAAVSLIPKLISRGYQLVTVSEMAAYRGITLKNGSIYYKIS